MPKRDRYGIFLKIEHCSLELLELAITAAFAAKEDKRKPLESLRIKAEIVKQLVRVSHELNIVNEKIYIALETDLREISKMTNGWFKYLR